MQTPDPRLVRRDLEQIVRDYLLLTGLPKPAAQENGRRAPTITYGHPAQWASDNLSRIANLLWQWHTAVSTERNEAFPPPERAAERVKVTKAWQYLETRVEPLIAIVGADSLTEMGSLHAGIRSALGYTGHKTVLPIACPNLECGLRTLIKEDDHIMCQTCGHTLTGQTYQTFVKHELQSVINGSH